MTRYAEHVNEKNTPQTEQARPDQVENNAGGFVFALDKWSRLDRFLVLGSEGGSYYVDEKKLTKDNAASLKACIAEDGPRVVRRIVVISDAGRAPKNDPAIFALAMCAGADPATRKAAMAAMPKVCRIGTHLFHFVNDAQSFRGFGRGLKQAIAAWYEQRSVESLALQAIKYQQRDGWSHRDLLRLSHATPPRVIGEDGISRPSAQHAATFRWITKHADGMQKDSKRGKGIATSELPAIIQAFEEIHAPGVTVGRAMSLIREHKLPHECVPNELKGDMNVWRALLEGMGPTAILRNLAKMTSIGLLAPMATETLSVAAKLMNLDTLRAGRVHPMAVLLALKTYQSGHGVKGSLTWTPAREVVDALDTAFYLAFQTIRPTGKRQMLALDVSGSMDGNMIAGTSLDAREASAAMAMVTARTETKWMCTAFTAGARGYGGQWGGAPSELSVLDISPKQRLDDVVRATRALNMGGTDCALPMLYAMKEKIEIDAFVVYTDSETWAGSVHPFQALKQYRQAMGIQAKLVVVGMTASGFTIADPNDAGMLDVVGFDAAAPAVIAYFIGPENRAQLS